MSEQDKTLPNGLVVFFEGIDGVGKTTQLELAAEELRTEGWSVQTTRGHGGTEIGEALREVSLSKTPRPTETDLHISLAIHRALAYKVDEFRSAGQIILIDRGPLSIAGYQMYGDGLDHALGWEALAQDLKLFSPELNILYTAAVSVARDRILQRSGAKADYFESKPSGYFDAAQQGYMDAAERFGARIIEAEQPLHVVHDQTMSAILDAISQKQHR
jgi:dTMP kinase